MLLGIALTFTTILTNVFIDLDGVLNYKKSVPPNLILEPAARPEILINNEVDRVKALDFDDNNEDSEDPSYRTRRSIESDSLQKVKNSAYKKVLTSRLQSLLEELDKEETVKEDTITAKATKVGEETVLRSKEKFEVKSEDLLHFAMHNILLQGIIGHKDLNQVYNKVHDVIKKINSNSEKRGIDKYVNMLEAIVNSKESSNMKYNEEHKFFEEIIKCKKLKNEIAYLQTLEMQNTTDSNVQDKDQKLLIKTVIEISGPDDKYQILNSTEGENIEGLIRLIYNGKSVKIRQMNDDQLLSKQEPKNPNNDVELIVTNIEKNQDTLKTKKSGHIANIRIDNLLNKVIEQYLESHPSLHYKLEKSTEIGSFNRKRLKRQIKIRYLNDKPTSIPTTSKSNKDDDDLYIEIETHFDKNGIIGEKKKKLVRSLIEKIQKALRSDNKENDKNPDQDTFKQRFQDPIDKDSHTFPINKSPPFEAIEEREVDPIDKTLDKHKYIFNKFGGSWNKMIQGPRFLSYSKSINSAEMKELNVNYDSVTQNGIPQRFQKPLNADVTGENNNVTSTYADSGNVTLFLKNIDGTGFSIGINQYLGEPPDKESMKIFNGLENLIKEYRRPYDQDVSNESGLNEINNIAEEKHDIKKRDVKNLKTKPITEVKPGYYSFYTILKNNALPFKKYFNVFHKNQKKLLNNSKSLDTFNDLYFKKINIVSKKINLRVENNGLNSKLNSLEISNKKEMNKNKRSVSVKKVSNIKSKIKLSRYLNTNAMAKKKIFLKNKRNKRQIDKIRIIAKDPSRVAVRNSDENIFLVSKENTYSDIRGIERPEILLENKKKNNFDEYFPFGDEPSNILPVYSDNLYSKKINQYGLMSKYPHIFIDERSNEEVMDETRYFKNDRSYRILPKSNDKNVNDVETTTFDDVHEPKIDEIFNAIMPPASQSKFKVTVKLYPKNKTNIDEGFKEIYTSVNKSFDEDGLRYFSVLNVSQISKIEKLNKSLEVLKKNDTKPLTDELKNQGKQINTLLQLHKKRVDQQLESLLRESQHLEQMIKANSKSNVHKIIDVSHDDLKTDNYDKKMNEVLESIKKLQETYISVTKPNTGTLDNKSEIINTIKSNEKITYDILKKIDINTQILTAFLQNFSNKVELNKQNSTPMIKPSLHNDWKSPQNFDYKQSKSKNNTEQLMLDKKHKTPIANDLLPTSDYNKVKANIKQNEVKHQKALKNIARRMSNESKFFMDEVDSGYKIAPDKDFEDLKINVTNIQ
ncbi:unnamed protein product, partial [Brenthis ino]